MKLCKLGASVLILCIMTGCSNAAPTTTSTDALPVDVATDSEAESTTFTSIKIKGDSYSIPLKVSDLLDAGFTIQTTDVPTIVYNTDCIGYFEDAESGAILVGNIGTPSEEELDPSEGYVFDILEDTGNTTGEGILTVYGDINISSTVEEVQAVFGEPAWDDGNNQLYYKLLGDGTENSDMVCVAVSDGAVKRVEVNNSKDFKEPYVEEDIEVEESVEETATLGVEESESVTEK